MNFKERYDEIIKEIEDAVKANEKQITEMLSKKYGIHTRMIADAFQFISGVTLSQYIKQRRIINAINYKFEHSCSLEVAAAKYGFPDSATLSKACKSFLGISPSQISRQELARKHPLTIDALLSMEECMHIAKANCGNDSSKLFGIDREQFATIKDVLEINAIYGLPDEDAELAYELSVKHHVSLPRAFEFVEDMLLQEENGTMYAKNDSAYFNEIADLCFRRNMSISESIEEIERLYSIGVVNVSSLTDGFLEVYFSKANESFGFDAETINDIVAEMEEANIPTSEFDDLISSADFFGGDISEAILNYSSVENLNDLFYQLEDDYHEKQRSLWDSPGG